MLNIDIEKYSRYKKVIHVLMNECKTSFRLDLTKSTICEYLQALALNDMLTADEYNRLRQYVSEEYLRRIFEDV